jgi:hypothetical protein
MRTHSRASRGVESQTLQPALKPTPQRGTLFDDLLISVR